MSEAGGDEVEAETPLHIDDGLPVDRIAWPEGVLERLGDFAQGDVVRAPPLFYFADPTRPVWARTQAYAVDSPGPEVVDSGDRARPRYGVLTSQTCDIVEEDADVPVKPWVQVSPVYDRGDLSSADRSLLRKGRGFRYLVHLPALPHGFWVADLRIEVPVEKGWLASAEKVDGFGAPALQRRLGQRLATLRARPAFGRTFVINVQRPLIDALRELRRDDRPLFDRMHDSISEVAVDLDDHLEPTEARLLLLADGHVPDEIEQWWRAWWDEASERAAAAGFRLHALDIQSLDVVTAREYRDMTIVPLDRISPD